MGFLSAYSGTRRVYADPEGTYWVDLREYVTQGEKQKAERALSQATLVGTSLQARPDIVAFRELMVLASIAGWNLDDENGKIWPVTLERVRCLPAHFFDELYGIIDELNGPRSTEDQKSFRVPGDGGGPVGGQAPGGDGDPDGAGDLPSGAAALETARAPA